MYTFIGFKAYKFWLQRGYHEIIQVGDIKGWNILRCSLGSKIFEYSSEKTILVNLDIDLVDNDDHNCQFFGKWKDPITICFS